MTSPSDVDVLVMGPGEAGLTAPLSARDSGVSRVLVAETEDVVSSSSRLSGGLVMGAGTRYQKALGIDEDAKLLFHDGAERVARVHCPAARGQTVTDVLTRRCHQAAVEPALGRRVDRLLVEDGAVVGAGVGGDTVAAGAVVIASGGFSSMSTWSMTRRGSKPTPSCFIATPTARVTPTDMCARLRYVNKFERRHGEWCIRNGVCADEWRRTDRVEAEGDFAGPDVRGKRSIGDIVYQIFVD